MLAIGVPRDAYRLAAACWLVLIVTLAMAGGLTTESGLRTLALVTAAGLAFGFARALPARLRGWSLTAVLVVIVLIALLTPDLRSGEPAAEPLGYANANGALLALGVVAAAALMVTARVPWRWASAATGLAILAVLPQTRSFAATALAGMTVIAAIVVIVRPAAGRAVAALTACALVAVVGVTLLLGLGYAGPGAGVATDALSSRRVALWSDAVALTGDQPLRGSGLGTFPERSETARSDADTRFTHSLTLEIAAESGILAAAACLAGLVLLTLAPTDRLPGPRAALASCAVAVFTVQASIDYTYRFPAVVLAASAVAGLCAGPEVQASAVRPTRGIRA